MNGSRKLAVAALAITIVLGVTMAVRSRPAGVSEPSADGLEEAARTFYLGMASPDPEENRRAMAAWVPTEEDFEELFPGHGARLWQSWGPEAERLITEAPARSSDYRDALPFGGLVKTADLREEGSIVLKRTLELMGPDVPVLGGMIKTSHGERVASSVVQVRGRWIWIWQLERAGALIVAASATPTR